MLLTDILNLTGLIFNVVGSILLAVSLSKYLTSIHGAAAIHDMQLQALINKKDKVLVGDVANLLKVGVENGRLRTTIGLILIVTGFILQLIPYIVLFYKQYITNAK
jgi:hypothetical protein